MATAAVLLQGAFVAFPRCFVLCCGGFRNILYAFGVGYGLNMLWSGATTGDSSMFSSGGGDVADTTERATVCSVLMAVYGVRLATFLLRRQASLSYAPKMATVQEKSGKMHLLARGGIVFFVAALQSLYTIPLRIAATLPEEAEGRLLGPMSLVNPPTWLPLFSALVAATGLVLQTVADEQKMRYKEHAPKEPVMGGAFSLCRFPAYTGEIMFHCGVFGLCIPWSSGGASGESAAVAAQVLLAAIPTGFMSWVMVGAAKRLDTDQGERYSKHEPYLKWRSSTSALWPKLW